MPCIVYIGASKSQPENPMTRPRNTCAETPSRLYDHIHNVCDYYFIIRCHRNLLSRALAS